MSHKQQDSPYKSWLCRKTLKYVFDTLDFSGTEKFDRINTVNKLDMKDILYKSYSWNLEILCEYARDNHLDEVSFILELRDVLLRVPGVREYEY